MNRRNKRRIKMKKKPIIICCILLLLVLGSFLVVLKLNNDKKIKEIKKYYHEYVITKKKTTLYNKYKQKVGSIEKDISFELKKTNINSVKDEYFRIKDTDYYIHYTDTKESKKIENKNSDNYIPFNRNIKTKKKIILYDNDKKVITLDKGINAPIESMDKDNYYISFLNNTYKVKKDKSIKEIKSNNTKEKQADNISVLFYEDIEENCSDYNCTTINSFKDQVSKLKENGYYTITTEEFKNYISGMRNLKDKAILINTANYNDNITNLNNELKINIEKLEETNDFRFISTYKPVKAGDDKVRINRYQIKNYTTTDDLLKMSSGEEVKQSNDAEINNQSVPVLNYHFFYAPGQTNCNESICLNTDKFREHLQYLKDNNFKTLTMEEFKKWMYGEIEIPSKSILLTVDDGAMGTGKHNGNYLNPLLEEYKLNATLFLITGWWDIENYRGPYLDIQSHTNDMHQYGTCGRGQINCATYDEAKADLQKSIDIIGNTDSFCFPFYMTSDTSIKAVKDSGFKMSFVGGNRNAKRTDNKWLIPRYPILSDITMDRFKNIVN